MTAIETVRTTTAKNSLLLRVLLLGALVLVLQFPVILISGQIQSRAQTRDTAREEVTSTWGKNQTVIGPMLLVPYVYRWKETKSNGEAISHQTIRHLRILPEQLKVDGDLRSSSRYRGIFEFSVYRGTLTLNGSFVPPDFSERGVPETDVLWDRAELLLYVSDTRALGESVTLSWNGQKIDFRPGARRFGEEDLPGIRAPLKGLMAAQRYAFGIPLALKGSVSLCFTPMAKSTQVALESDWPSPSFKGNWLPDTRQIDAKGFTAAWSLGYLGRNFPQIWEEGEDYSKAVWGSAFGLDFGTEVDEYRMAERSVKYALLFLGLTFVLIWLYEVLGGLRVHPIQYLLVGGALCLFYLLLLALSEHIGFGKAYTLGAALVTLQVTAYGLAVLGSRWRALLMGAVVGGLYAYLYVLLQLRDYALLVGAIGLFVALTVVMYSTRKVDWYGAQQAKQAKPEVL